MRLPWVRTAASIVAVALFATGLPLAPAALAGNGDPIGTYPNYFERATLALTNACRQGPQTYRNTYLSAYPTILQPQNYPPQPPLYWNYPLNQSSRAHSTDMATNGCFSHNSCDGTLWNVRIQSYYSESGFIGENIAAGYSTPFDVLNGWLIDGGAADLSAGDGHRANIMSANYHEMGNGYAFNAASTYDHYWTQDFGGGAADFVTPLAWGSHAFTGDGNIHFFANYYSGTNTAPQEAALVVGTTTYPMTLTFGTAARGTYTVTLPMATGCRTYRFRFRDDAGTNWFHPENGSLRSTGEGGCTDVYVAAVAGVPSTSAPALEMSVSPNPVSQIATIRFRGLGSAPATVRVFDLSGRLVRETTVALSAGDASWTWDARDSHGHRLQAGIYLVQAEAGGWHSTRRVALLAAGR